MQAKILGQAFLCQIDIVYRRVRIKKAYLQKVTFSGEQKNYLQFMEIRTFNPFILFLSLNSLKGQFMFLGIVKHLFMVKQKRTYSSEILLFCLASLYMKNEHVPLMHTSVWQDEIPGVFFCYIHILLRDCRIIKVYTKYNLYSGYSYLLYS